MFAFGGMGTINKLTNYRKLVTPNLAASALALGTRAVRFLIRESSEGCVLSNELVYLPPFNAAIRFHNSGASEGS